MIKVFKTRGKKGSLNKDLKRGDLILVFDEIYKKVDKYGKPIINGKTGRQVWASTLAGEYINF